MSDLIDKAYASQFELAGWIDEHFNIEYRGPIRPITCFDFTIEHHAAICLLCEGQLYGSMFALLRIAFESYVRGLWLRYSASPSEIAQYDKEKLNIKFGAMITSVENSIKTDSSPLSNLKNRSWKLMNSFTHSGFQHLLRRNATGQVGTINYDDTEICSVLNWAGTFSLLSSIELSSYSGNQDLEAKAMLKAEEYAAL